MESEQRQLHDGNNLCPAASGEGIKTLLFESYGKTKRIRHRHAPRAVVQRATPRLHVGNQQRVHHVVIIVKTFTLRPVTRGADRPSVVGPHINSKAGPQRLGNRKITAFHAPGPHVLRDRRGGDLCPELMPESAVATGLVVFVNRGPEQKIAGRITGDEGSFSPRTSQDEIESAGEIPRVQVLLEKWSCFADHMSIEQQPIAERTGGDIQILPEQVLIHFDRRDGVATQRELEAGGDGEMYITQPPDWADSAVEYRIVRVAPLNEEFAGKRKRTAGVTLGEKPVDRWPASQV